MTVPAVDTPPMPSLARQKHLPGEAGTWIFILGDMCVFAVFFAAYMHGRGQQVELFRASQDTLNRNLGAINTLLLLLSSLFVVLAMRAAKVERARLAGRLFVLAFCCGAGFGIVKVIEYHAHIAAGQTPATNEFYMYYFILTGIHAFHLLVGMVVLLVLRRLALKPVLTMGQRAFFEGGACFWHMVDLLWLVLFPLLFLVR